MSFFFLLGLQPVESPEPDLENVPVGIVLTTSTSMHSGSFIQEKVGVFVEGILIITMPTLADGYVILFGIMYALHLQYPKGLANTFDFFQSPDGTGRRTTETQIVKPKKPSF